jgi:LPXTG-motif cell wall-anchored protein
VVAGTVGFVASAASATTVGGVEAVNGVQSLPLISLHNDTASAETDCPAGGAAYWHFVFAPNNGSAAFVSIILKLKVDGGPATEELTFTGAQIIPNGAQTDNVFVAVPAGHALTDLVALGSYATYTGTPPNEFNLSHVCEGVVPTTSTTSTSTTSTSTTSTSTTSTSTTSTTSTSTTEAPTTTTTAEGTTTTTAEEAPNVLGTVQTTAPAAVAASGTLPYTGTNTGGMVAAGLAILLGGLMLVGLARTRNRTAEQ